ncbi:MAG: hypothetical protein R2827_05125 [Bdellovibrionales bacterium]
MPHLIIESTQKLSKEIVSELHKEVGRQETVNIEAVKTRVYSPELGLVGGEEGEDMVTITLKLLPGRNDELKNLMAQNLYTKAAAMIDSRHITVEVVDLGVYKK